MSEQVTTDEQLAKWVVDTCLLFGTTVATAHRVAAIFVEALANE